MAKVKIRDSSNPIEVNKAIRRFNRMVMNEGILKEVKRRKYFISKPKQRKLKQEENQRRINKKKRGR